MLNRNEIFINLISQRFIMAIIDLINCVPEALAESAALSDLMESIQEIDHVNDRQAEVLDYVYRHRLVRLLRAVKRGDDAVVELKALYEHLNSVTHPRRLERLNSLEKPYGARWIAYQDILEHRFAALMSEPSKWILKRAHVKRILSFFLSEKSIKQKEIRKRLKLKPANLTRILGMMAANELVNIHTIGREKIVTIGENGEIFIEDLKRSESKNSKPSVIAIPRGSGFLSVIKRAA